MSSGWRVIDCSSLEGKLRSQRGQILVCREGQPDVALPVADLAVILIGPKVSFSAGVMHRLTTADVAVLFTDWRGVPFGGAYSWSDHTRVGARNRAQAEVSVPRRKALWGSIVRAKIMGQAAVLEALGRRGVPRLRELAKSVRSGDPANAEAQAARIYWDCVFPSSNFVRVPSAGAGENGCLDYGYAIIRGHGIRAVLAAGLSPALGVFHRGRSNAFNLVDDLMEPFRPVVDQIVAGLPPDATPADPDVKRELVAVGSVQFDGDGHTVPTVMERLAQTIGRYFEGDEQKVPVPCWSGRLCMASGDDD